VQATEIHLWTVPLDAPKADTRRISEMLSPDEQRRAEAFRFEKHRSSFIVGRGVLRSILGWYLLQPAKDIIFKYGAKGKPALGNSPKTLHFNLAHSERRVVYAFSDACELGVDIELLRSLPESESIARNFFSPEECAQFFSVPADKRTEAFFNCWTRKEAYLKAIGDGLIVPLNSFQVSLIPGQPATFLNLIGDRYPISQWSLSHLDFPDGYIGALAIPLPGCTIHWRTFSDTAKCFEYLASSVSSL
jgi:4'-phosphopantetheinyl transferase